MKVDSELNYSSIVKVTNADISKIERPTDTSHKLVHCQQTQHLGAPNETSVQPDTWRKCLPQILSVGGLEPHHCPC